MVFDQNKYLEFKNFMEKNDPKMHALICKHGFLAPLPARPFFVILVGNIIGQKIRFSKARKNRANLYTHFKGDKFTPDQILEFGQQGLESLGIENWQAEIIMRVAKFVKKESPTFQNIDTLQCLKGIGPWTLQNTKLMYTLQTNSNYPICDVLLIGDLIIRRGLGRMYQAKNKKDFDKLQTLWSPYNGLVTWYLWKEFT